MIAPGNLLKPAGISTPRPFSYGRLLINRASELTGVTAGGRGIPGFAGTDLRLDPSVRRYVTDCFLRKNSFAVVGDDGALCLRVPQHIAEDLVENGLAVSAGKNLLTWPIDFTHQLETNWRILLHAYWNVTGVPEKRTRRMWSEYVIQH